MTVIPEAIGRDKLNYQGKFYNLKVEVLAPVLCKGVPTQPDFEALDRLADTIAAKHKETGLT